MTDQKFKNYSCRDFVLDDEFRRIVHQPAAEELNELIAAFPEKEEEISLAITIVKKLHAEQFHQAEERKQLLWSHIIDAQKKKKLFPFLWVAATILLLIGIGSLVYIRETEKLPLPEKEVAVIVQPSNAARLILSNGETVQINTKQSTVHVSPDGTGIIVNDSSGIAQTVREGYNQLIVPYGKRSKVILADGSKVWVNSGSKLIFPPVFKGKSREVTLEGEALFEVSKDPAKPFFVKTDDYNVKVYGTKFDVQAYQWEHEENVVLVEGSISMNMNGNNKEVFLKPNQKVSIYKGESDLKVQNVADVAFYTAWAEGYLIFNNEEVRDVLKRVSRYYNITIQTELSPDLDKICGKLDLKDDVERLLDGIAFISKTKYTKENEKYLFFK
jgi:ferric-dicitrate binding protein FerR (iron transport regulator)